MTALVGPSGGGKTTLLHLIARFWDVHNGSIRIGGADIREVRMDTLMTYISVVFQDVYLFHDTIENNIRFGRPEATDEEVVQAAQAAHCHDFISAFRTATRRWSVKVEPPCQAVKNSGSALHGPS